MKRMISFLILNFLLITSCWGACIRVKPSIDDLPIDNNGNISYFAIVEDGWVKIKDYIRGIDHIIIYRKGNLERGYIINNETKNFKFMWEERVN